MISQSPDAIFWVQTQFVVVVFLNQGSNNAFQHLVILCPSVWYSRQSRLTVLETTFSSLEFCSPFYLHVDGSFHLGCGRCFLRQHLGLTSPVRVPTSLWTIQILIAAISLITLGVFLGLTLFTFQSKYDFSGMGPFLFGALIALVMTGFIGMIFPFGRTMDIIFAIGGCLIFSGYIVYDTYIINKRLSPDEYIMGSISLYLEYELFCNFAIWADYLRLLVSSISVKRSLLSE